MQMFERTNEAAGQHFTHVCYKQPKLVLFKNTTAETLKLKHHEPENQTCFLVFSEKTKVDGSNIKADGALMGLRMMRKAAIETGGYINSHLGGS